MQEAPEKTHHGSTQHAGGRRLRTVLACLLLGLALAVPVPFVNTAAGYTPLIAYLLVLLLSFAYLKLLVRGLSFETQGVDGGCYRGEQLTFRLVVRNAAPLPAVSISSLFYISDLFGAPGATTAKRLTLPPRSAKTFEFGVRFDHIGTYEVGMRSIEVTDPFGIFHHVKRNAHLHEVHVQPRIHNIAHLQVSTETALESKRSFRTVINDGMDYSGVREYRWGDPLKAIHWKLSAREVNAEYFTRLYETVTNPGIEIILDTDCPEEYGSVQLMHVYDALVEAALSIEDWGASHGFETLTAFADASGRTQRFEGPIGNNRPEVLARIPRIAAGSGRAALDLFTSEAMSIYAQSNLILCTSCINPELVGALLGAQANRRSPLLIAVVPPGLPEEEHDKVIAPLSRVGAAGIPYAVITSADELKEQG